MVGCWNFNIFLLAIIMNNNLVDELLPAKNS